MIASAGMLYCSLISAIDLPGTYLVLGLVLGLVLDRDFMVRDWVFTCLLNYVVVAREMPCVFCGVWT
jgi:hypothetical protein